MSNSSRTTLNYFPTSTPALGSKGLAPSNIETASEGSDSSNGRYSPTNSQGSQDSPQGTPTGTPPKSAHPVSLGNGFQDPTSVPAMGYQHGQPAAGQQSAAVEPRNTAQLAAAIAKLMREREMAQAKLQQNPLFKAPAGTLNVSDDQLKKQLDVYLLRALAMIEQYGKILAPQQQDLQEMLLLLQSGHPQLFKALLEVVFLKRLNSDNSLLDEDELIDYARGLERTHLHDLAQNPAISRNLQTWLGLVHVNLMKKLAQIPYGDQNHSQLLGFVHLMNRLLAQMVTVGIEDVRRDARDAQQQETELLEFLLKRSKKLEHWSLWVQLSILQQQRLRLSNQMTRKEVILGHLEKNHAGKTLISAMVNILTAPIDPLGFSSAVNDLVQVVEWWNEGNAKAKAAEHWFTVLQRFYAFYQAATDKQRLEILQSLQSIPESAEKPKERAARIESIEKNFAAILKHKEAGLHAWVEQLKHIALHTEDNAIAVALANLLRDIFFDQKPWSNDKGLRQHTLQTMLDILQTSPEYHMRVAMHTVLVALYNQFFAGKGYKNGDRKDFLKAAVPAGKTYLDWLAELRDTALPRKASLIQSAQSLFTQTAPQAVPVQVVPRIIGMTAATEGYVPRPAAQQRLLQLVQQQARIAISGGPGTGKTTLAKKILQQVYKDSLVPMLWELNADSHAAFMGSVQALLRHLQVESPQAASDGNWAGYAQALHATLARALPKGSILLLDNLNDAHMWKFLQTVVPESVRVVVTTQIENLLPAEACLSLQKGLDEKEALSLLTSHSSFAVSTPAELSAATELVKYLSYSPLSIVQYAEFIRVCMKGSQKDQFKTYADFLNHLQKEQKTFKPEKLAAILSDWQQGRSTDAQTTALWLTLQQISTASPAWRTFLDLAAFTEVSQLDIPLAYRLYAKARRLHGEPVLEGTDLTAAFDRELDQQRGLLTLQSSADGKSYLQMHRSVQQLLIQSLMLLPAQVDPNNGQRASVALLRLRDMLATVNQEYSFYRVASGDGATEAAALRQVSAALAFAEHSGDAAKLFAGYPNQPKAPHAILVKEAGTLMTTLRMIQGFRRGQDAEQESLTRRMLAWDQNMLSLCDRGDLLKLRLEDINLAAQSARKKVERLEALRVEFDLLNPDCTVDLDAKGRFWVDYSTYLKKTQPPRLQEANAAAEQILKLFATKPAHFRVGQAHGELAIGYDLMKQPEKGLEHCLLAIDAFANAEGPESISTLRLRLMKISFLIGQKNTSNDAVIEAEYLEVLAILERMHGKACTTAERVCGELGDFYKKQGKRELAAKYYIQQYDRLVQLQGPNHPHALPILQKVVANHGKDTDDPINESYLKEMMRLAQVGSRVWVEAANNLARIMYSQRRTEEYRKYANLLLERVEQVVREDERLLKSFYMLVVMNEHFDRIEEYSPYQAEPARLHCLRYMQLNCKPQFDIHDAEYFNDFFTNKSEPEYKAAVWLYQSSVADWQRTFQWLQQQNTASSRWWLRELPKVYQDLKKLLQEGKLPAKHGECSTEVWLAGLGQAIEHQNQVASALQPGRAAAPTTAVASLQASGTLFSQTPHPTTIGHSGSKANKVSATEVHSPEFSEEPVCFSGLRC